MKCVVPECKATARFYTGYMFTHKGEEIISDEDSFGWCEAHVGEVGLEIALPVFDSAEAVLLFAEKHPQIYFRRVDPKRKIIVPLGRPRKVYV